ncbi:MAG: hypothetical protein SFX19_06700 [Alphaproteobacteria bacterium]|nr:hypothetical protein [Alphaproteobacteria bacterium]
MSDDAKVGEIYGALLADSKARIENPQAVLTVRALPSINPLVAALINQCIDCVGIFDASLKRNREQLETSPTEQKEALNAEYQSILGQRAAHFGVLAVMDEIDSERVGRAKALLSSDAKEFLEKALSGQVGGGAGTRPASSIQR